MNASSSVNFLIKNLASETCLSSAEVKILLNCFVELCGNKGALSKAEFVRVMAGKPRKRVTKAYAGDMTGGRLFVAERLFEIAVSKNITSETSTSKARKGEHSADTINFDEYVRTISPLSPNAPIREKAFLCFRLFDLRESGAISREDMICSLRRFFARTHLSGLSDEQLSFLVDQSFRKAGRNNQLDLDFISFEKAFRRSAIPVSFSSETFWTMFDDTTTKKGKRVHLRAAAKMCVKSMKDDSLRHELERALNLEDEFVYEIPAEEIGNEALSDAGLEDAQKGVNITTNSWSKNDVSRCHQESYIKAVKVSLKLNTALTAPQTLRYSLSDASTERWSALSQSQTPRDDVKFKPWIWRVIPRDVRRKRKEQSTDNVNPPLSQADVPRLGIETSNHFDNPSYRTQKTQSERKPSQRSWRFGSVPNATATRSISPKGLIKQGKQKPSTTDSSPHYVAEARWA